MTKKEFINQVAESNGISIRQVDLTLKAITETLIKALLEGKEVNFTGFGKFYTSEYKGRTGKDLAGNPIYIEPRKRLRFKPSTQLKKKFI